MVYEHLKQCLYKILDSEVYNVAVLLYTSVKINIQSTLDISNCYSRHRELDLSSSHFV